jgi:hypothetical protein
MQRAAFYSHISLQYIKSSQLKHRMVAKSDLDLLCVGLLCCLFCSTLHGDVEFFVYRAHQDLS